MKAIVWSKPACGYCVKAKSLLKSRGIEVEEKNIEIVKQQKPFSKPVNATESFNPVSQEQSGHQNYAAWVLGESFDINQLLEAHLIS